MSDIVPRNELAGQAVKGVGAVAGGVVLLVLAGSGPLALIIGGLLTVVGLILTGSPKERTAGIVTAAVGAATMLTRVLGFPRLIMQGGGLILLGVGVYWVVKFFRGMKKRM